MGESVRIWHAWRPDFLRVASAKSCNHVRLSLDVHLRLWITKCPGFHALARSVNKPRGASRGKETSGFPGSWPTGLSEDAEDVSGVMQLSQFPRKTRRWPFAQLHAVFRQQEASGFSCPAQSMTQWTGARSLENLHLSGLKVFSGHMANRSLESRHDRQPPRETNGCRPGHAAQIRHCPGDRAD